MPHADSPILRTPPVSPPALKKSLLLHTVVLGLMLALPYLHRPPEVTPPKVVEAVLLAPSTPSHTATAKPVIPELVKPLVTPPVPVEPIARKAEPKAELPTPKTPPLPVPVNASTSKIALPKTESRVPAAERATPAKPLPVKPIIKPPTLQADALDEEMQLLQQQLKNTEAAKLNAEAEKAAASARQAADLALRQKYERLINQRVQTKWNRPLSARHGMVVTLRIAVLPGGEVSNVVTLKSSGDRAFDASAEEAVRRANPLPVPDDIAVFNQYFRVFTLKFNPEDL